MLANLVNLAVWLLLAMFIVLLGWDEPIKYRFMSQERRDAEERALFPPPPVPTTPPPPDYRNWGKPKGAGASGSSLQTGSLNATPKRR